MSTISDSESTIDNGASHRRPSSSPSLYWFTLRTGLCILELVLTSISAVDGIDPGIGDIEPIIVETLVDSATTTVNLPTTVTLESTITAVSESTTTLLVYFFLSVFRAPRFNSPWGLKPFFDPPSCHIGSATSMLL